MLLLLPVILIYFQKMCFSVAYTGHPKSFQPRHVRQQYFPQFIHQWNVHPLQTESVADMTSL